MSERQRGILAVGPFAHGGVVVLGPVVAHQLQDEHAVRRTDATLSIGYDFLIRCRSDFFKHCPQLVGRLYRLVAVVCDEVQPFEMNGARNAP